MRSTTARSPAPDPATTGQPVQTVSLGAGAFSAIELGKIPKTGELIARELRKRIVRGELVEGASLPAEAELMSQLSVSRASLREALRILESEALLTVRRGSRGGPVVHRPDPNLAAKYFGLVLQSQGTTLEDVYATRLLIEPPAVRLVLQNAQRQAPGSLHDILKSEREALERADVAELARGIARFHDALIELSGNKTLLLVMNMLNILYEQHIAAIERVGPSFDQLKASRLSIRAQERLIDFIEAGDEDAAVAYWRTHLLKVKDFLFNSHTVRTLVDVV